MRWLASFLWVCAFGGSMDCAVQPERCVSWVRLSGGRSRAYTSSPLKQPNPGLRRALIVIHGQDRDASEMFRTALAAAFLAGRLEDTLIAAPKFTSNHQSCRDALERNELNWRCSGENWRTGGFAIGSDQVTSFDFVDQILQQLANKDCFPNLQEIVVSGHSAGGQYVSRYVMSNKVHEHLGVAVRYVVSNPSSYVYPDSRRPGPTANCATFDSWPYGLQERWGYAATLDDATLRKQLARRGVTYLLGELDTVPIAGFDSSCGAMAQGPNRLERGKAYAQHMVEDYRAPHRVVAVPLCGHNSRCLFTSNTALPVLFGGTVEQ